MEMEKEVEILKCRIEGEVERRIKDNEKWQKKMEKLIEKMEEMSKKMEDLEGKVEKLEREKGKEEAEEQIDKRKALIVKKGRKWRGENIDEWIKKQVGEEKYKVRKVEKGVEMKMVIFEETFVRDYMWRKREAIAKESIYIVDEILNAQERRERWERREKEREERWKKEEEEYRRRQRQRKANEGSSEEEKEGEEKGEEEKE